jgi:hypothetical protein
MPARNWAHSLLRLWLFCLSNAAQYMKPPRRRLTVRALIVITTLFALDFGGIAWVIRGEPHGGVVQERVQFAPVVFFVVWPYLLLSALVYLYVPRRLDEILAVILNLVFLCLLIMPAMQHS